MEKSTLEELRFFEVKNPGKFSFKLNKNYRLFLKRLVVFFLITTIEFVGFPAAAFAQVANQPTTDVEREKQEKIQTLITDTETAKTIAFTGEGHGVKSVVPAMADVQASNGSAGFEAAAKVRKLAKEHYRPNEEIDVVIENGAHKQYKTELIDAIGNKVALETDEIETGAAKIITIEQPSAFRPGKYTLRISDNRGGVSEQDFSWGVLAINPDKSIYAPNETANLAIGVLDEGGDMVCDAQVELQITAPGGIATSLSTDNGKIIVNEECKSHDFTLKPDYETTYQTTTVGAYKMLLKSQTKNGTYSISDSFEVRASVPFDVKRVSATRIYPPNTYPVTLEITANQDFEGTVSETVPGSFKIAKPGEEIKSDTEKADALIASQESLASASADILAPDSLPKKSAPVFETDAVLAYNTINTVGDFDGGKAVLGASIPGLGMPFSGPYPVTQEFGESLVYDQHGHELYDSFGMQGHDGVDFAMPIGTPLLAVDAGKVLLAGAGDYGTTIVIQHAWGRSYYGHLSGVEVKEGDEVQRGATIGRSGNTGFSTGPHLHFGIKPDKNESENGYYGKVDPAYYLGMKQSATAVLGAATKFDDSINAAPSTDVQILTWKINVKKGDKIKIGYNYLAPRISPQFYTLGPATFTDTAGKEVFHEIRKWQIASDALDYKFKRGTFQKSTCAATCTQTVGGVGFKPKAVIFEWSLNTAEGFAQHQVVGMGFATADSSGTQERSLSYCAEDGVGTSDSSKVHSATKVIIIHSTDCAVGTALIAQADFVSFDSDGFTLSWTTNNSSQYIIHYTAIGGADVSNAKAGSFTLSSSGATQAFTDPGFQPDFVMFLTNGGGATDTNLPHASMSAGFATGASEEVVAAMLSEDAQASEDTCHQQDTAASIIILDPDEGGASCATQDGLADVASFDATGFTLNVTNTPTHSQPIYYLALRGGQYDVGSFTQPTSNGPQSVTTGFKPSGLMTLGASQSAATTVAPQATLSTGGASRDSSTPWCNDTTGVRCTLPDTALDAANDWCNDTTGTTCTSSWSTRKKITLNASSSANLTNFPVLVKLDSTRINYAKTQGSGQDLRFVDPSNNTTVLSHEIETWNESGESFVWVKVPQIDASSSADFIWMYYDNSTAPDGQDTTNVWDSNYALIQHMNQNPSGTAPQMLDSTSNNFDGTSAGSMTSTDLITGKIGSALDFDGTDDAISLGDQAGLYFSGSFTLSGWVKVSGGAGTSRAILSDVTGGSPTSTFDLRVSTSEKATFWWQNPSGTSPAATGTTNLTTAAWHHVTSVWDGTARRIYVNGVLEDTTSTAQARTDNGGAAAIGRSGSSGNYFNGHLDEIQASNTARSANWIRASYLTQSDMMNTYGSEELYSETQSKTGWTARKKITFSNIASAEDLDNFPVLVTLNSTKIDYNKTQGSGQDIRFVDPSDPNTVLPHEIEQWNESGTSYVWVKVPRINKQSNTDHIWMYYGNPSASDGQDTASVWNGNYRGVWHTKETSGTTVNDSTSNNNRGTLLNGAAVTSSGKIGYANTYDGTNDVMKASPSATLNNLRLQGGGGYTVSAWINIDTSVNGTFGSIATKDINASITNGWVFQIEGTGNTLSYYQSSTGTETARASSTTFTDDVWTYVTMTHDGSNTASTIKIYLNGTEASYSLTQNGTGGTHDDSAQFFTSGCDNPTTSGECVDGMIDELRVSNVIRSADWIEAEYLNMNDTMNIFGAEETAGSTTQTYSQGSLWSDDLDANATSNANAISDTTRVIRFAASPTNGTNPRTVAAANFQSFDPTGFTVNWTDTDSTTRLVLYWAAGSVTASQEDYRWYKNTNAATPTTALEDENNHTILARNKPYARLRTNISTGGNGLNGSTQGFKLQYAANQAEVSVGGTDDWCNDGDGVACVPPTNPGNATQLSGDGWQYRKKITFNNASASAALDDFPVLIKLDSSTIDYSKTQNSGQDIRFVDPSDKTTVLPHEIESWNENGTSYVWVKVESIDAGTADYIWMYYGNASAPDGQATTSVWDSSFALVQHLEEAGTCVTSFTDSTTPANDGTCSSGGPALNALGKIGNARSFDNADTNDTITMTDSTTFEPGSADFSISAWIYPLSSNDTDYIFDHMTNGGTFEGYNFYINKTGSAISSCPALGICFWDGGAGGVDRGVVSGLAYGQWSHVAITRTGTTLTFYVNGVNKGSVTIQATIAAATNSQRIGQDGAGNGIFNGSIDEVRYSTSLRSTDWVEAEYNNIIGNFTYIAEEQPYQISGTSTVGWRDVADIWCNDSTGVTCNTSWTHRKRITINNQSSSTALDNFPVLVKLDASRIDYGKVQEAGQDLRFVDPSDPNTAIPHEIEVWNEFGESYVWVQVDLAAKSTTNVIWMYYGNSSVGSPATQLGDNTHATNVWGTDYELVHHLEETSACSTTFTDSTSNSNNGTCGGSPIYHGNGPVDGARDFNGTDQYVRVEDSSSIDLTTNGTWEAWVNIDSASNGPSIIQKDFTGADGYSLGLTSGGKFNMYIGPGDDTVSNTTLSTGTWHHIVAVKSGTTMTMYLNGVEDGSATTLASIQTNAQPLGLGIRVSGPDEDFNGRIDEARVSSIARSADWVKTTFLTEADQMNTFGNEETQTSAVWRFKDNSVPADRSTIASPILSTSTTGSQLTYQESNVTALNPTAIAAGEKREFDFSLDGTLASNRRTYFFRIVNTDGTPLTSYARYPTITVGVPNQRVMRGGKYFNYKNSQPFTF